MSGQKTNRNESVTDRGTRLRQAELNQTLLSALGRVVSWHNGFESKPLELDIGALTPLRLRVYIYNATYPPGGRTLGERKIQLIVPGQSRGEHGELDHSDGRIVLLIGYEADVDVFILWDAGTYRNFSYSMNVQVNAETIFAAFSGKTEMQKRIRRTPTMVEETVVCAPSELLMEAITKRISLSLARLLGEAT
ncbi:MAG: hypothetical protein WCJ40_16935 [Planctomycetota bacterium]